MIPDDIAELPEHWLRIREPIANGDRHEAVKRLRLLVDADPFALAPRHVLASLLVDAGHGAAALVQFEKLLTAAVTRGDLFRAIAVQRRIDELGGRVPEAETYIAIQRWFRLAGAGNLLPSAVGAESGLTPVRLMRLPAPVFAFVATQARLQRLDTGWHIEPFQGACQWILLWGALRWEVGRRAPNVRQRHVGEGESLHAVVENGDRAPLRIAADVPSECLVFDPTMLRQLAAVDPQLLEAGGFGGDIVREDRAHSIPRPGAPADLDHRPSAPRAPQSEMPPTLRVEPPAGATAGSANVGDWLEPGLLSFEDDKPGASDGAPPAPAPEIPGLQRGENSVGRVHETTEAPAEKKPLPRGRAGEIELPAGSMAKPPAETPPAGEDDPAEFGVRRFDEPASAPASATPAPADAPAAPASATPAPADAPAEPASATPAPVEAESQAAPAPANETPEARRERRRRDRTPVAYRARVRLHGLEHALGVEMDCQLVNLSPTGARIELPAEEALSLVRILEGETLRIELEPNAERLKLVARVRWLEIHEEEPVQAGLEFVLLTRGDLSAILRLIVRALRSARAAAAAAPEPGQEGGAAA